MEIVVDNTIIKAFLKNDERVKSDMLIDPKNHLSLRWPSLLEFLNVNPFTELQSFDEKNVVFQASIKLLHTWEVKDHVLHMYDRLFAEILSLIKAAPEIQPSYLLEAIDRHQSLGDLDSKKVFNEALHHYKTALYENISNTIHDLILYLAWDRMCVWIAHIFDHQSSEVKFLNGIKILKECLVESYLHITNQGRTFPSIYRLFEALVYYNMRQNVLDEHKDDEFALLSRCFPVLKGDSQLSDYFYIDDAVSTTNKLKAYPEYCYLTLNTLDDVNLQLDLARFMLEKLALEFPGWNYKLKEQKIISLA